MTALQMVLVATCARSCRVFRGAPTVTIAPCVVESFFATLEWELIERSDWHTRDEARLAIFEYIECWYNQKRRHSSLGYLSPAEYELQLLRQAA